MDSSGRAPENRRALSLHHTDRTRDGVVRREGEGWQLLRRWWRESQPRSLARQSARHLANAFRPQSSLRRRSRRHRQVVSRGAGLWHRRAGDGRTEQGIDDRCVPVMLEQGARRGVHSAAGEGQVPPCVIRARELGEGAARSRHPVAHPHIDRYRADAARHYAWRDRVFLRPVGQSQRGIRGRLHLLSGQAADYLDRRGARAGDLLPRSQAERAVPVGIHVMKIAASQDVVHWEAAAAAVTAAVRCAEDANLKINVAVVDSGGNLAAFLRMPGGFLHSITIAIDKAYTAAGFGLPTSAWTDALKSHSQAVRDGLSRRPRMVCFGGGLPLRYEGRLIGGIGVSGGSEEQDEACARAGLVAIGLAV